MKRTLFLLLLACCSLSVSAQVDNYALHFTSEDGIVNCGQMKGLLSSSNYTLQFWFCPDEWKRGACLLRVGTFSIKLGNNHALVINDGKNHLTLTDAAIRAGRWAQVTIRSGSTSTTATINNTNSYKVLAHLSLPVSTKSVWLGGGYKGRIDEVRIWKTLLTTDYNSFYDNTLNELNPYWNLLHCYYKMDQEQCPNLVDYKDKFHGTLSASGVVKEKVTDNTTMTYRKVMGYGNVERFFDRTIDAPHYNTLANMVYIIGIWTYNDGSACVYSENDAATLMSGAQYAEEYAGRKGVVELPTTSAYIKLPAAALPTETYTFETWVYIDEWTEGAYIMRKEASTSKGLSLRLGTSGQIIARLNGEDKVVATGKSAGKWFHIGVCSGDFTTPAMTGVDNQVITLGQGLKGKFDETLTWSTSRNSATQVSDGNTIPYPGPTVQMGAQEWYNMKGCYDYDKADDPGFDRYSVYGFLDYMRNITPGMRGTKFVLSAAGPGSLDATVTNQTYREKMGKALAAIVNSPYVDGIDLDFEWSYTAAGWNGIAEVTRIIRENVNPGKLVCVSAGSWSCNFPVDHLKYIDYVTFQCYGPSPNAFSNSSYQSSYNTFINHGFTKDKMLLSFSTTTSAGYTDGKWAEAPRAYRYNCSGFTPDTETFTDNNKLFHVCSINQCLWRTQFVKDNDVAGIFYWDLGCDLPSSDTRSLARNCSYIQNANVEMLVTSVESAACDPAVDDKGPTATEDPEDQGGGDIEEDILSLGELSNTMAYTIKNSNGLGMIYSNADQTNLWLAESSNSNFSATIDHKSPSALWLLLKHNEQFYLYNIDRDAFVKIPSFNVTSQPCTFETEPQALVVTADNGKFYLRQSTTSEKDFMCASPQLTAKPVCQWTATDNGSQWTLTTCPSYDATAASQKALLKIDPTGIEDEKSLIPNPSLEGEGGIYDLSGRKLQSVPHHGIFIVNGRKVMR